LQNAKVKMTNAVLRMFLLNLHFSICTLQFAFTNLVSFVTFVVNKNDRNIVVAEYIKEKAL
jgi:hypothetical protein